MPAKILVNCTHGKEDPERATLSFVVGNVAATADQEAVVLLTIVQRGNLLLRRARPVRRTRGRRAHRVRRTSARRTSRIPKARLVRRNRSMNRLRDRPRSSEKVRRHRRPSATRMPHVTQVTRARGGKARSRMFRWPALKPALAIIFFELCGDSRPRCPVEPSSARSFPSMLPL